MKLNYKKQTFDTKIEASPVWYFFYTPINKNVYKKLADQNPGAGSRMWERAAMFGKGWIGVDSENGTHEVKGEYNTVLHKGAYKGMMDAYKQLMKDYPDAKEYYNVYLNSPDDVEEADQETLIVFR